MPTTSEVTIVGVVIDQPPAGMSTPKPLSSCFRPAATPMPASEADDRGDQRRRRRLEQTEREHLLAAGPDGPQQRHLLLRWATMIEKVL